MDKTTFLRKLCKLLQFIFLAPILVLIVILIRSMRSMVVVRFTWLPARLIGHAATDPEMHLAMIALGIEPPKNVKDFFFFEPSTNANEYWSRVVKRHLPISYLFYWVDRVNQWLPGWEPHSRVSYTERYSTSDPLNLLGRVSQQIRLTASEDLYGQNFLANLGIPTGAKFVCLQIRDSAHDTLYNPAGVPADYSSFRNAPLNIFINAIEYLIDRGYWVIRLGKVVEYPLPMRHPRLIDYACQGIRTELADIWLCFNCTFMVSTGSGIDALAAVGRKPDVCVNLLGYTDLTYVFRQSIVTFKRLREGASGRILSLAETLSVESQSKYRNTEFYRSSGLLWEHNTSDEILGAVKEMHERIAGVWKEKPDSQELQAAVASRFLRCRPYFETYQGQFVHKISDDYLRKNHSWLYF
jgi:putative glycosyltransferase (TIGR04372 family)